MGVRVQRNPAKVPKKKGISSMAKPKDNRNIAA